MILRNKAQGSIASLAIFTFLLFLLSSSVTFAQTTFNYTGGVQTYTVPSGVTTLTVDVRGAAGGLSSNPTVGPGGLGGRVTGTIPVTAGQVLNVYVGGNGGNGTTTVPGAAGYNGGGGAAIVMGSYSGGGGGGASDIRATPYALANRLVIGGGGGGGSYNYSSAGFDRGGNGGGTTGESGYGGGILLGQGAGSGGSQVAGGIGGTYTGYCTASNGALGLGGAGGTCGNTGGGGGGGYYGGGGGVWGGGGGGSNFLTGGTHTQGYQTGNGQVVITPNGGGGGSPCATPSNVTANASTICAGAASNLSAISAGNNIDWYTVPTGGVSLGSSPSGANFAVTPVTTTTYYAEANSIALPGTQTFSYTGSMQTFTVPSGITSLTVDLKAGAGGTSTTPLVGPGGLGGRVTGTITVTSGQVLNIYVGGVGANGTTSVPGAGGFNGGGTAGLYAGSYSGGGGGGASDIRVSPYALANRVAVAGGGGGGAYDYATAGADRGGNGGGLIGEGGYTNSILLGMGHPGAGGSQVAGGAAGNYPGYCVGFPGTLGIGGNGGTCTNDGGGGGGGYYGGGGGVWGGGGGGSSYLTGGVHTQGFQTGSGEVVLTWSGGGGGCTSSTRVPVTVTVETLSLAPTSISGAAAVCPGDSTTLTQVGATLGTGANYNWYTGSCGGTLVGTGPSITVSPTSATTYYVRAEGNCNATPCATLVVTPDNIAPTAICQAVTVVLDQQGNGTTTSAAVNNGSTDNCTIDTMTLSQYAFTCANAGTNTVTMTVTDLNGNSSTCTATVIVQATPGVVTIQPDTTACGYSISCAGASNGVVHASVVGGCGTGYTFLWSTGATTATVSGLAAGTYTVTITYNGGGTTVQTVVLVPPPVIDVVSNATSTCFTDTAGTIDNIVTGGNGCNGYSYQWSNGATTQDLFNLSAGSYTVTVNDAAGCTFIQTVVVSPFPIANPTFSHVGNTLVAGQTWVSYQWLLNGSPIPGATSSTYVTTQNGNYSLQVTDSNGCTGLSGSTTVVSISDPMGDWMNLTLYPNPANGQFRLRTASPIAYGVTVNIFDMYGRRLVTEALPELSDEIAFDIHTFAAGSYIVEALSEIGQRKLFRLVVR